MAENDLRVAGRDAEVLKQGRGGVPQMVDLDVAELVLVVDAVERADEITRLDGSACLGGEDEAVVLPSAAELLASVAWACASGRACCEQLAATEDHGGQLRS